MIFMPTTQHQFLCSLFELFPTFFLWQNLDLLFELWVWTYYSNGGLSNKFLSISSAVFSANTQRIKKQLTITLQKQKTTYSEFSNSDEIDAEVLSRLQVGQQSLQIRPRDAAKNSGIIDDVGFFGGSIIEDIKFRCWSTATREENRRKVES